MSHGTDKITEYILYSPFCDRSFRVITLLCLQVLHGDGRSQINYSALTGFPSELLHSEREFEYRWDFQYVAGLLMEERLDFGAKTGLSNAKFTYEYDSNFRLTGVQGRIGGQNLPEHALGYNIRTGALEQFGQFKVR
jgi:hypothetical protein